MWRIMRLAKSLAIIVLAAVLLILPVAVQAEKGVGLSWNTESVTIKEGEKECIMYGVYNPFNEDATVKLFIIGEAANFMSSQSSEKAYIRSHTSHDRSQLIEICFEVKQVYDEDCIIGNLMCEQACRGEAVSFGGEVLAAGTSQTEQFVVGSKTEFGVAAPLEVTVECVPRARDLRAGYYASGIIAMSLASYVFYRKFLKKKRRRK